MEDGGAGNPGIPGFGTDGFETILQSANEGSARGSGVTSINDPGRLIEIDFRNSDKVFDGLDESGSVGSVCEGRSVTLPSILQHLSTRIDELDAVILLLVSSIVTIWPFILARKKLTTSGLCEAVTITPMVFPSSLLLLNAARTPTLKRVESRMLALSQH